MENELILITTKKASFLKRNVCLVSFFKDEVFITTIDKAHQKALYNEEKNQVKAAGGGLIKQTFAMSEAIPKYAMKVKAMTKKELNQENTESINKTKITKLKYTKAKRRDNVEDNTTSFSQGKLILFLSENKIKFHHNYEDYNNEIKNYLNGYLEK